MISRARILSLMAAGILSRGGPAHGAETAPTFAREVAPIIFQNCASCHRPGQSAPFSLLSFSDAKKHAKDIAKATGSRYMPPWLPERGVVEFAGERHLTDKQIETIQKWAEAGAPEGNPSETPPAPSFPDGWLLGAPDLVVKMPEAYRLAPEGKDLYRNFVITAPLRENRFVRAFEFHPKNRAVHHVRIKLDSTRQSRRLDAEDAEIGFPGMRTPGKFPPGHMTTWVPGQTPRAVPEGLQWPLAQETDLILEVHLRRTGKPELIQPEIAFYFTNTPPSKLSFLAGLTSELIDIPAGDSNYMVERKLQLPADVQALTILPHLHYLGKEVEAWAILPGGAKQWLLRIPDWDFNWQGEYRYAEPIPLPAGSILTMRYRYDNSAANIRNPSQPPRRVVYGPQSTDEMGELWLQVLVKSPDDLAQLQKVQRSANDRETIGYYERQLEINPSDAAVHLALGKVLGPEGRLEEAVQHFRAALAIDPRLAEAHYYLALSLFTARELNEAREEFEAALRLDADYYKAHDGLGLIALRLNQTAEAAAHFRHALEINPEDPAALANLRKLGGAP